MDRSSWPVACDAEPRCRAIGGVGFGRAGPDALPAIRRYRFPADAVPLRTQSDMAPEVQCVPEVSVLLT